MLVAGAKLYPVPGSTAVLPANGFACVKRGFHHATRVCTSRHFFRQTLTVAWRAGGGVTPPSPATGRWLTARGSLTRAHSARAVDRDRAGTGTNTEGLESRRRADATTMDDGGSAGRTGDDGNSSADGNSAGASIHGKVPVTDSASAEGRGHDGATDATATASTTNTAAPNTTSAAAEFLAYDAMIRKTAEATERSERLRERLSLQRQWSHEKAARPADEVVLSPYKNKPMSLNPIRPRVRVTTPPVWQWQDHVAVQSPEDDSPHTSPLFVPVTGKKTSKRSRALSSSVSPRRRRRPPLHSASRSSPSRFSSSPTRRMQKRAADRLSTTSAERDTRSLLLHSGDSNTTGSSGTSGLLRYRPLVQGDSVCGDCLCRGLAGAAPVAGHADTIANWRRSASGNSTATPRPTGVNLNRALSLHLSPPKESGSQGSRKQQRKKRGRSQYRKAPPFKRAADVWGRCHVVLDPGPRLLCCYREDGSGFASSSLDALAILRLRGATIKYLGTRHGGDDRGVGRSSGETGGGRAFGSGDPAGSGTRANTLAGTLYCWQITEGPPDGKDTDGASGLDSFLSADDASSSSSSSDEEASPATKRRRLRAKNRQFVAKRQRAQRRRELAAAKHSGGQGATSVHRARRRRSLKTLTFGVPSLEVCKLWTSALRFTISHGGAGKQVGASGATLASHDPLPTDLLSALPPPPAGCVGGGGGEQASLLEERKRRRDASAKALAASPGKIQEGLKELQKQMGVVSVIAARLLRPSMRPPTSV